jgi:hypothetical protein
MQDAKTSYQAATELGLPESFSECHGRLLDFCLIETGAIPSKTNHAVQARDLEQGGTILTQNDLRNAVHDGRTGVSCLDESGTKWN